ncbi:hypothetical protein Pcinc_003314 [Petrolisthes cinctipes]|uniref:Peptidase A2 domain-containing protein n=1 Tax=Petrolisthes cinctipes TaxID=88211 RepID=A0AAE1GGJ7_PETCI|nr:hypothetical protein Pcinc_003314 [Petrolisthes cinctipes]
MPKPKKPEQEVAPHSPTTPPVGESHDVILQMLQLFRDECEQKRQEDIRRREAEEERFNRLVATLGGQTMQQGDVSSPVGDPVPVSPSTPVVSTPMWWRATPKGQVPGSEREVPFLWLSAAAQRQLKVPRIRQEYVTGAAGDKSGWVECMPDTGADTTVMGSELLDTLGLTSADLRPSPELGLSNPDGSPMACPILGSLYATMTYGDVSIQGWIIVVCGLSRQLLSYHHTKQLRIVPQDYPRQIKRQHLDGSVRQIAAPYHPTRKPRLPLAIASPNEAHTATSSGGDMVIDGMRVAAQEDIVYTQLLEYVTKGFPTTCDRLDPAFKPFWKEHGRCDLPDTTPTQECQAPDPPKPRRRCRGRCRGPLRRSLRVAKRS